jgi:hypothetical protein
VVTFYPASGNRHRESGAFTYTGFEGDYWSSASSGVNGFNLVFNNTVVYPAHTANRAYGFPVRCVQRLQQTFLIGIARATAFVSVSK